MIDARTERSPGGPGFSSAWPPGLLVRCPSWAHLRHFVVLWALVGSEFALVFIGADFITAHRHTRLHIYLSGELAIPFIPSMVVAYMSIYLIFLPAPFVLRSRPELDALAAALMKVIAIAGVAFLAIPAELGFAPTPVEIAHLDPLLAHRWGALLGFADWLNLDYDLIPSLHVALFVTCAGVYALRAGPRVRTLLGTWGIIVTASTVLTHQHQLIDAATGVALGAWGALEAQRRRGGGAA
jgi:hypothetical protein